MHTKRFVMAGSLFCLCCLCVWLLCWIFLQVTRNQTGDVKNPTLTVEAGFNGYYRSNYWTPVQVTLTNPGPAFKGTLALHSSADVADTQSNIAVSPWNFEQPVSLAAGTHQKVMLYAPYFLANLPARGFVVTLRDEEQRTVVSQWSGEGNEVKPGNLLIGLVRSGNTDLTALQATTLPNQVNPLDITQLDAHSFPDREVVLESFDILILEDFPLHTLSSRQILSLQTWVNRGGILVEIGGPYWQQTLQELPASMMPVVVNGTKSLSLNSSSLLPIQTPQPSDFTLGNTQTIQPLADTIPISTAILRQQAAFTPPEIVAGDAQLPLMVKAYQGAGVICYVGFDPIAAPLNSWSGTTLLWQNILLQTLGDRLLVENTAQSYDSGPGRLLTHAGILNLVKPIAPSGPTLLKVLLCGYVCILGLLCLLFLQRFKRAYFWRWRLLLSCVIVFSLVTYGLAYYQKKSAFTSNAISLLQINQDGSSAHITTFTGLFLPTQDTFQVHIPGDSLSEPVSKLFTQSDPQVSDIDDTPTTITNTTNSGDLRIKNQSIWAFDPLVTEKDRALHGKLYAHLMLHNKRLVGTMTNTLASSLNNLSILFPHTFVDIGQIAAGQTRQIDLPIHSTSSGKGKTLADQIDDYNHLPESYFPYTAKQLPRTEFQQHMALLSALTGTGFSYDPCTGSCLTHAIMNRGTIYVTGGQVPNPSLRNDYDPLLIPGAQATLIGWTGQQIPGIEDTTINDGKLTGQHISFLQMPLNLGIASTPRVPQDFITGNLTNVQSYDAQSILAGIYALTSGNVTFDLPLPSRALQSTNGVILNVPDLITHPDGAVPGNSEYKSNIAVHLYNWQTSQWDTITLTQDSYRITQLSIYAGSNNHLLVEIANRNQNTNQIYFGKPSIT